MARTFIGELLFLFKDQASAEAAATAKKITSSFDNLAQEATRLNSMNWSWKFQRDIEKLNASSTEIDKIRSAWNRLHDSFKTRGLDAKGMSAEIAAFESVTKQRLASFNKIVSDHQKEVVARTKTFSNTLQTIMKPAMYALGGFGGAYMVGVGGTAAITAASNEQRERARQHFAGLPKNEQDRIEQLSKELSTRYNTRQADAMEIMREARLSMPDADKAFGVAEQMIQGYKMLGLMFGGPKGIEGLRAFNKAMDNLNVTENPQSYREMLDAYIRAQQVTGKDMDPEAFALAIKYSRASGKVFSKKFLKEMVPFLISETNGSDTGNQLRAMFDTFIADVATKKSLKEQGRLGLREKSGGIVEADKFAEDPIKWINETIVPALIKDGVDVNNDVELAQAVSQLASNRLAKDFIMRAILGGKIYQRLADMMGNAVGLEGAGDLGKNDPFTAMDELKGSFANLSAAVLPAKAIAEGLNTIASGVNALQAAYREGAPLAKLGMGAGAAGAAFGAYKIWGAVTGLITAGTNLNAAAVSLEAAALSLKGGGVAGAVAGSAAGAGGLTGAIGAFLGSPAAMTTAGAIAAVVAVGLLGRDATKETKKKPYEAYWEQYTGEEALRRQRKMRESIGVPVESRWNAAGLGLAPPPAVSDAQRAGQEIKDALSVTAKPEVDSSAIDSAIAKAQQLKSLLSGIASAAAAAHSKVEREMQRNFADHGVAP